MIWEVTKHVLFMVKNRQEFYWKQPYQLGVILFCFGEMKLCNLPGDEFIQTLPTVQPSFLERAPSHTLPHSFKNSLDVFFLELFLSTSKKKKEYSEAWTYLWKGEKCLIFPNSHTFFPFFFSLTGGSKLDFYFDRKCYFSKLHKVELGTLISEVYI